MNAIRVTIHVLKLLSLYSHAPQGSAGRGKGEDDSGAGGIPLFGSATQPTPEFTSLGRGREQGVHDLCGLA